MVVCQVCEHQQSEQVFCDVCGVQLVPAPQPEPSVVPVPDLELTHFADAALEALSERLPDLEPTLVSARGELPLEPVPEFETHHANVIEAIPVLEMMDIDRGRELNEGEKTAAVVGDVTCRYCRTPQVGNPGVLCTHCGMRLPRNQAPRTARAAAGDAAFQVCSSCGTASVAGRPCRACGARVYAGE